MILYLLALMLSPVLTIQLFRGKQLHELPIWACVCLSVLWVITFQSLNHVAAAAFQHPENDIPALSVSFFITMSLYAQLIFVNRKQVLRAKAALKKAVHDGILEYATGEASKVVKAPRDMGVELAKAPSHILPLLGTHCLSVVKGVWYLGEIDLPLDKALESLDNMPQRAGSKDNVAFSNSDVAYLYIDQKWFYATTDDFVSLNKRTFQHVMHFDYLDTQYASKDFTDLAWFLRDRPTFPDERDMPDQHKDTFFGYVALDKATQLTKEECVHLRNNLKVATNSFVIQQFKDVADLPDTNYRAFVIRQEAAVRSALMANNAETAIPFTEQ